jgi:hypothetical protein
MRHRLVFSLLGTLLVAGCDREAVTPHRGPEGDDKKAIIVFTFHPSLQDTMRVLVRDSATIHKAQLVLQGKSIANIPIGPILRGTGIDPRYQFHFIPDSVRLAEVTIELCDGRPMKTEAMLDMFFRGASRVQWCPWSARVIAVE